MIYIKCQITLRSNRKGYRGLIEAELTEELIWNQVDAKEGFNQCHFAVIVLKSTFREHLI